ncbi:hypothetical protein CVT26_007536 [Gymnopilus dilepis]|uniref:Uncharacterized protein n=1 Tax=Gymnopilus dilepis TaxID=231916 RepID=A0A409W856_9AGAR|nr:hypothetical protein CVT26_007536 [Gymnopilus dilepis]
MSVARIFREDRKKVQGFEVAAVAATTVGIAYCLALNIICSDARRKEQINEASFYSIPKGLIISALTVDVFSDSAIAFVAFNTFMKEKLAASAKIRLIVGFGGSFWTSISGIICWTILLTKSNPAPPMIFCIVNVIVYRSVTHINQDAVEMVEDFRTNSTEGQDGPNVDRGGEKCPEIDAEIQDGSQTQGLSEPSNNHS